MVVKAYLHQHKEESDLTCIFNHTSVFGDSHKADVVLSNYDYKLGLNSKRVFISYL